jgi:putative transposase
LLRYTKKAYYKHKSNRIERRKELFQIRGMVMRIRSRIPRLGTRKLYFLLKEELADRHIKIGRDVLFNFLRAEQ